MCKIRILIVVLSLLVVGIPMTTAQEGNELPQVIVTYTNEGITVSPSEVPAGLTTLVMDNQSDTHAGGPIGRFKDGKTMEDFIAAAAENPFEAILVFDLYGSLSGLPGSDHSITVDLQPGDYVFISGMGQMGTMTVIDNETSSTEPPAHDVDIVMIDFAFGTPSNITAGEQVWRIENKGEELHEFLLIPVEADTTHDEAKEMFQSMGDIFNIMAGNSPIEPILIWGPLNPGFTTWVPVNLEPGTYALGCLIPDISAEGNEPVLHIQHDMIRIITVE